MSKDLRSMELRDDCFEDNCACCGGPTDEDDDFQVVGTICVEGEIVIRDPFTRDVWESTFFDLPPDDYTVAVEKRDGFVSRVRVTRLLEAGPGDVVGDITVEYLLSIGDMELPSEWVISPIRGQGKYPIREIRVSGQVIGFEIEFINIDGDGGDLPAQTDEAGDTKRG